MDKDDTAPIGDSSRGDSQSSTDFINILEMLEDLQRIQRHHNCFTKELLSHRKPGEGRVIFYLTDIDGEIQASITFLNREKEWNGESKYYHADLDFKSTLFENVFSEDDFQEMSEIFSDTFLKVMPNPDQMILEIPSDKMLHSTDVYPNNYEQRETGISLTLTTIQQVSSYLQDLEDSQYHIDNLKSIIET